MAKKQKFIIFNLQSGDSLKIEIRKVEVLEELGDVTIVDDGASYEPFEIENEKLFETQQDALEAALLKLK